MTEKDDAIRYSHGVIEKKLEAARKRIEILEVALRGMLEGFREDLEKTTPGMMVLKATEELLDNPKSTGAGLKNLARRVAIAEEFGLLSD